jgi:hypothetical protein
MHTGAVIHVRDRPPLLHSAVPFAAFAPVSCRLSEVPQALAVRQGSDET